MQHTHHSKLRVILVTHILNLMISAVKQLVCIGSVVLTQLTSIAQPENNAFSSGEVLQYRMYYGFINAGIAKIELMKEKNKMDNQPVYHAVGTGETIGVVDWFFKVRDRYESYFEEQKLVPRKFIRRVDEGGYKINQDYIFKPESNTVTTQNGKEFDVPTNVQDMLSVFYYARATIPKNPEIGKTYVIQAFVDEKVWPLRIKCVGTDTIRVDVGRISCLKFVPVVQQGRIFKQNEDLMVWVSNDTNKIPVFARAKIIVGSIKVELMDYSGLRKTLSLLKSH